MRCIEIHSLVQEKIPNFLEGKMTIDAAQQITYPSWR